MRNQSMRGALHLLTAAVALLQFAATAVASDPPPNIIIIVSDDQGYADLGSYGSIEALTPHTDRLARDGVRLTSCYVAWPACGPSRAALLTGRYPQRNGLYENVRNMRVNYGHRYTEQEYATSPEMTLGMDVREVTLAQVLRARGYYNGVFGKWDGGRAHRFLPLQRGFDEFYGFCNTGIDYWTHERYGIHSVYRDNERTREDQGTYFTHLVRREAMRFLRDRVGESRPFFLYVPFFAPHSASNLERSGIRPPAEYLERHDPVLPLRRREYLAAISAMDDAIGEILDFLDEHELSENTIVIFMSDNGGEDPGQVSDNSPLRSGKGTMFEGGVRVPFLMRWPGYLPAGDTNDEFLTAMEVFPTLLKATGAPRPDVVLDGFDMLPILRREKASPRSEMFWLRLRAGRGARVDNWKWVEMGNKGGLFNLEEDLGEQHDLSESHPGILSMVKERYNAWLKEMDEALDPRGPFRNR